MASEFSYWLIFMASEFSYWLIFMASEFSYWLILKYARHPISSIIGDDARQKRYSSNIRGDAWLKWIN